MVHKRQADSLICGTVGVYREHLHHVLSIVGLRRGVRTPAAMNVLILDAGTFCMADTYVVPDPTAAQIADITMLASEEMKRFGLVPKVALLSHSNFGSTDSAPAVKMREALRSADHTSALQALM